MRTSVTRAFAENGDAFVLGGNPFQWVGKWPHLPADEAARLIADVIDRYTKTMKAAASMADLEPVTAGQVLDRFELAHLVTSDAAGRFSCMTCCGCSLAKSVSQKTTRWYAARRSPGSLAILSSSLGSWMLTLTRGDARNLPKLLQWPGRLRLPAARRWQYSRSSERVCWPCSL
jgi:hypothetical protein